MSDPSTTGGGLRKVRRATFVQVPSSTIRDAALSFRARGVLAFLLDHPDGWKVDASYVAKHGREGREAVEGALRELRAAGYYRLERRRLPHGGFAMGTAIAEEPVAEWAADHVAHDGRAVPVAVLEDGTVVEVPPTSTDAVNPQVKQGNGFPGPVDAAAGADAANYSDRDTDSDSEGGAVPGDVTSAPSPTLEAPKRTCQRWPSPHGACGACADDNRAARVHEDAVVADAREAARQAAELGRIRQAEQRATTDDAVRSCRLCTDAGIATVDLVEDGRHDTICQHDAAANTRAVRSRLEIRQTLGARERRADDVAIPEHRARARARAEHPTTPEA